MFDQIAELFQAAKIMKGVLFSKEARLLFERLFKLVVCNISIDTGLIVQKHDTRGLL